MADKDAGEPSLELPSLGLRRRRRKRRPESPTSPVAPATATAPAESPAPAAAQPGASPHADGAAHRPLQPTAPRAEDVPTAATAPPPTPDPVPEEPRPDENDERTAQRPRREVRLPRLGGYAAAVVTGILVGVITVGLTWAGFRLCELVRGTSSCGDPGFLLLLAILVAMILLGAVLLRAWGLPDPGSTSFLAVGLLAVMVLLFLVQSIFSWWMVIVIPAVAAASFALAHWVTRFITED